MIWTKDKGTVSRKKLFFLTLSVFTRRRKTWSGRPALQPTHYQAADCKNSIKLICGLQQFMKIINRFYIETTSS